MVCGIRSVLTGLDGDSLSVLAWSRHKRFKSPIATFTSTFTFTDQAHFHYSSSLWVHGTDWVNQLCMYMSYILGLLTAAPCTRPVLSLLCGSLTSSIPSIRPHLRGGIQGVTIVCSLSLAAILEWIIHSINVCLLQWNLSKKTTVLGSRLSKTANLLGLKQN